jgi:2-keto-4-pentenoate hydratase
VTGEAVALDASVALAASTVEVRFGGTVRDRAGGAEVMGGPEHSIAWLANKLAEFDLALEAGMRVMSGSFTRQYKVERGDEVVAAFAPFGTVRARFD